ncbi:HEAT repeat domain-containing protein [Dyadobacter chenwenxiniae]|uniref:HEAT repeat domain-containing protein n=1 Tax=Dyadobacter chenwenxiniae TaxID=2906456 RepID=A0A9X1PJS4_9BACT|nr:HEAT repeat domain-containing protein [Dyadobacter chenwenxiniae]MCF0061274.1 HEAT repeat domain-containing protein [Dyadobacter chenwenxiniae]UON81096.1 HEAT repeat domain-containing protein [Dyadobacter chenwenxiniae]
MISKKPLLKPIILLGATAVVVVSCMKMSTSGSNWGNTSKTNSTAVVIKEDAATGKARAKEIREKTVVKLADGLKLDLWATDSLAPDPVAISVDDMGRVYLNRTNRQKNSEFDIRGHQNWMTASIGLQTVEERRAFLRSTFAPEKSKENSWLKDLNGDGSHDWKDLAVEKDEVWRIEDTDNDGIADISMRVLDDFFEEVSDVAGGVLVRAHDAFVAIAPDLWRLRDTNGDGVWDQKKSISHGYGVHIGFGGHGMSNPIEGPDGKIYWNIGDIGANITTAEGVKHEHPNSGIIARSNPDGSDFEIFAHGLRNTHEFVFDEYGNLISSDNDGDHPGESERLVHVVEGSDAGWRSNWQYGKYTDPKNNGYKVWMEEKLYKPRWDGQAAYIIPPIQNFHNGPTGMQYNPGTALGSAWKNKFFLVEFVGNPARSPIWAFGLKPKGASFVLDGEKNILNGILPTGIRFGPDGALYVADWINGWDTKNYGRVWRLDVSDDKNDLKEVRTLTKRLMQLDYAKQTDDMLYSLLENADMRIRQKAQFELATRGAKGAAVLSKAIAQTGNQLQRIHGIWGMGQLAREDKAYANVLMTLLKDKDEEIAVQAAKVLGDAKIAEAGPMLMPMLSSKNPRMQFFGAQALGRIADKQAVQPLLAMIKTNDDQDVYLRHAAVLALSRIGEVEPIVALSSSPEKSLRTAAVLVLRRLRSEKISVFLQDKDEYIVTEAARGINDDLSITPALPALANLLKDKKFTSEPLLRRAINAALRVGTNDQLDNLIAFSQRKDVDKSVRTEALAALGTWASPSVMDRVDGRYRGVITRDPTLVKSKVQPVVAELLNDEDAETLIAAAQMVTNLGMSENNAALAKILSTHKNAKVRTAMLVALNALKYSDMETAMKLGMTDTDADVRTAALGMAGSVNMSKEALADISKSIFEKGSVREQQQMLRVLGTIPVAKTEGIFEDLIGKMNDKKLPQSLALDLSEAVDSTKSSALIAKLAPFRTTGMTAADFQDALLGGNAQLGRRYFMTNSAAECVRCHSIGGQGGEVGPNLSNIGNVLSREQILQALIEPSARLSPGFGMVMLTLKDGTSAAGILAQESDHELVLKTSEAEPLKIATARIAKRENVPSSMPPMGTVMTKREIRDVVEFLSNLKSGK